ncbi:hypothetical protein D9611_011845 [Ephemerocybe angulata]|uniref:ribonuclease H n=1 Tax=Ephemerocybe angulata TaxID=980116 RepID=A0A8H5FCI2_9AGAR|nr:hypothetical protein D9611_011845 [Tulosesus angulatus]
MGLGGHAEVYDGEMAALAMGIRLATGYARTTNISHLHFYADNSAAISSIADPKPTGGQQYAHTFHQLACTFLDSNPNNTISVKWCPGHSGIPGNERADRLAKRATDLSRTSPVGTTRTNAIRRSKITALKEWTKEWKRNPKEGWFAISDRIPPSLKPTKHARRLASRRELYGRVVQARTGHAYTGEFRRRFSFEPPHSCPCDDQTIETREHIITSCPRYEQHRFELRGVSPNLVLSVLAPYGRSK